jgi:hypothetical protein
VGLIRLRRSEVDLFRDGKCIVDLNAEIPDGALNFGVAEQELHSTQVTGPAVDQRRLCPPEGMGAEQVRVQSDAGNPLRQKPSELPRGHAVVQATWPREKELTCLLSGPS